MPPNEKPANSPEVPPDSCAHDFLYNIAFESEPFDSREIDQLGSTIRLFQCYDDHTDYRWMTFDNVVFNDDPTTGIGKRFYGEACGWLGSTGAG